MKTVQIISGNPFGACSYYRTYGVFQKMGDIECDPVVNVTWEKLANADILFIERPQDPNMLEICKLTKEFGIKLWVDFDDNLFCLPDWNPGKPYFDNPDIQECMIVAMELADIVTVATPAIKEAYKKYNKNIVVIPNAFNNFNYDMDYNVSEKKVIMWRGSTTHGGDLKPYESIIHHVAKENTDWNWHFMGNDLWDVTHKIDNVCTTGELDIIRYHTNLKAVNPAIYIVPLQFNEFNMSKSNCGWLEATYAGAVTLAPDMPEWRRPGITNYKNSLEFQANLEWLMNHAKLRKENYKKSFDFIKCNLLLSNVNKKRMGVVKGLCKN